VFDTPVTGGNVSFYNEDPQRAVFPTPTIGMVGLVEDINHITTQTFKEANDTIILLGETKEELGGSEYLRHVHGQTRGPIPLLNLEFEKKLQTTLLNLIREGWIKSAHDCSDGGLAVALAECCITDKDKFVGAEIDLTTNLRVDCLLFGETQSRVIVSCTSDNAETILNECNKSGIPAAVIGSTGGERLRIADLIDLPLKQIADAYYGALAAIMERVG